jgi:hypothetical protein
VLAVADLAEQLLDNPLVQNKTAHLALIHHLAWFQLLPLVAEVVGQGHLLVVQVVQAAVVDGLHQVRLVVLQHLGKDSLVVAEVLEDHKQVAVAVAQPKLVILMAMPKVEMVLHQVLVVLL